jgi:hypothetical protein
MYHRVAVSPLAAYDAFLERAADGLAATSSFGDVERLRFPWSRPYTRDEWLDQIRTPGNAKQLADAGTLARSSTASPPPSTPPAAPSNSTP